MQTPWTAEQLAAALVVHAHHPTWPKPEDDKPEAVMQVT
jgi:hypothetical protein